MRTGTIVFAILALLGLFTSCDMKIGGSCYEGHYAMREYCKPIGYFALATESQGDSCIHFQFNAATVASEWNNVEQFEALAAERGDYSEKKFKVCNQGPPLRGMLGVRGIRVLWPRAKGDTVDLSSAFLLEYVTYEDFIRRGYSASRKPALGTKYVPLAELSSKELFWLVNASLSLIQKQPIPVLHKDWDNSLLVSIDLEEGGRVPFRLPGRNE